MGKVLERHIVGIACEMKSCMAVMPLPPRTPNLHWWELSNELSELVEQGWVFVTWTGRLRAYCPDHDREVQRCTCVSSRTVKTCPVHNAAVAASVWSAAQVPELISELKGGA